MMGQKYDIRDQYGEKIGTLERRNTSPEQIVGMIILFFLGIGFIMWFIGFIIGAILIPIAVLASCVNMLKTGEIWQFKRWLALGFGFSLLNIIISFRFTNFPDLFLSIPKNMISLPPIIWSLITVLMFTSWGCLLIASKLTPDILQDFSRPSHKSGIMDKTFYFGIKSPIYFAWISFYLYLIIAVITLSVLILSILGYLPTLLY